ncbi:endonuclease/exonuclease/phosphatase family protein [Thermosporothrix hazakensis]|jgi:endonuclease/exonuclease/phosphatase family metal-dependent hydrolase|uniref:Endonuclease/exonuclease/phosphatase family protein n=1 Tax=Thermosporothrix hazakensis TaxID=644383 RepID=A0A326U4T7_THEHA|nr:endonuclease/exonuclease/phosphatase family protein [Thermosporothrix hazakensis]PZW26372.1 endonuclease/exonuclease/phosphatase family protein [Thermosporothrix hazakensis]GCE48676.1 hypothetical protein KTH_35450 [Thermosporothrix hazakensis]
MTRIVSYNILAGGYNLRESGARRTQQLARIIRSADPDIVGVIEATHPQMTTSPMVVEELAETLGMQLVIDDEARTAREYQPALLTRLPILSTRIHKRPGLFNRSLIEVCVEERNGQPLTVFVTHLSALFYKGWAGNGIREREMTEILRIMAPLRQQNKPHLLMGDFNSLSPSDPFKASHLLRYIVNMDGLKSKTRADDGHPHLSYVVPPKLRFLKPILRVIPQSQLLCNLFDLAASCYAPRGCMRLILNAGYVDCYRRVHPHEWGFTCPAAAPAGRIDYIFASPDLAARVDICEPIIEGDGLRGEDASDHLAMTARFSLSVPAMPRVEEADSATIS